MRIDGTMACTCPEHAGIEQPISLWRDTEGQYVHTADQTEAWTIHLHVDKEGRDCDGRMSWSYFIRPIERDDYSDHPELWASSAMLSLVPHPNERGDTTITLSADHMEASGPTDEGYFCLDVRVCREPDCEPVLSQRDHTAEAAGY